jgi:hypothetical protein
MTDISRRLRELEATLQRIARSANVDDRDRQVLQEAQVACEVGSELLRTKRAAQAGYACFYGESCVAVLEDRLRSTEMLRKLL